jgi:hypothetical protein
MEDAMKILINAVFTALVGLSLLAGCAGNSMSGAHYQGQQSSVTDGGGSGTGGGNGGGGSGY